MAPRAPGFAWFGSRGASWFDSRVGLGTIRADRETDVIKSALLKKAPAGTFESLYKRHAQDVYRYCRAMLGRQADAEDATQTTFLNAYRALERGETPRDARSWLQAIALNVCREHYRSAGRRPEEVSLDDDPGELVLEPPGPELGDVVRGLSCLPFNQRAALVMREFEGRSLIEVAAALEVSTSAVEALLFRARRALREQLEEKLTCHDAERAISRQLDGALARRERGRLRAHLRECGDCAALARRVRAQRSAIRSLAFLPLPASLRFSKLLGGGAVSASATAGVPAGGSLFPTLAGSIAAKLATVALAGAAVVGIGYKTLGNQHQRSAPPPRLASRAAGQAVPAVRAPEKRGSVPVLSASAIVRFESRRRAAKVAQAGRRAASRTSTSHDAATPARPTSPSASGNTLGSRAATSHGNGQGNGNQQGKANGNGTGNGQGKGNGNSQGNGNATKTTPASHGNQKPFKGNGNAYGRSRPKTKPPTAAQPTSSPPAIPPGQLKPKHNNGKG